MIIEETIQEHIDALIAALEKCRRDENAYSNCLSTLSSIHMDSVNDVVIDRDTGAIMTDERRLEIYNAVTARASKLLTA